MHLKRHTEAEGEIAAEAPVAAERGQIVGRAILATLYIYGIQEIGSCNEYCQTAEGVL